MAFGVLPSTHGERGLVNKPLFSVKTLAGPIFPEVYIEDGKVIRVKVDMGEPI